MDGAADAFAFLLAAFLIIGQVVIVGLATIALAIPRIHDGRTFAAVAALVVTVGLHALLAFLEVWRGAIAFGWVGEALLASTLYVVVAFAAVVPRRPAIRRLSWQR